MGYALICLGWSREIPDWSIIIVSLPKELGLSKVVSEMRFIRYPLGGYIAPHTDGVHVDGETGLSSTTSFLLWVESHGSGCRSIPFVGLWSEQLSSHYACSLEAELVKSNYVSRYLATIPEGEGGETEILDCVGESSHLILCNLLSALSSDTHYFWNAGGDKVPEVLHSISPIEGSILLFPHETPHQGQSVFHSRSKHVWHKSLLYPSTTTAVSELIICQATALDRSRNSCFEEICTKSWHK